MKVEIQKPIHELLLQELDCSRYYNRSHLRGQPIVYFLIENQQLVYIGSTFRFIDRVLQHLLDNIIPFEEVFYLITKDFRKIEENLIRSVQPIYNIIINPKCKNQRYLEAS